MESSSEKPSLRVTIVGAGLSGLTAAIGIQRAGHKVTILDKATQLREIGAGIHVATNAARVFSHWGLLGELEAISVKPGIFGFHSWTGETLSVAELNPAYENEFAIPYLLTHRVDLQKLLVHNAEKLGVVIRLACAVDRVDFSSATVTLQSGEIIHGDLAIGADGDRSISRSLLENRQDLVQDSGYDVYRATVACSTLLEHAPEVASLVRPYSLRMWVGPHAHMILYPLGQHDRMNIVFTREHPHDQEFIPAPQEVKLENFHKDFEGCDQRVHKILDVAGACWKRTMLTVAECTKWTHDNGRFALFGDAAHAFFPYMAQGAAMGIEDAGALSTFLGKMGEKSQLPEMIRLYEDIRKPRALELRRLSTAFKELYTLLDGPEQQARDDALRSGEPYDGWPNFMSDPVLKPKLYGYDVIKESERVFDMWKAGKHPQQPQERATPSPLRV